MVWIPPEPDPDDSMNLQAADKLRQYLGNDTDFQEIYDGEILDDDPTGISNDDGLNTDKTMKIALVIAGGSTKTATLGLRSVGTNETGNYLALMIYLFDEDRESSNKRKIVNASDKILNILLKYQFDTTAPQMWYRMLFRDPAVTYHSTNNFRQSIILMSLLNRVRNL